MAERKEREEILCQNEMSDMRLSSLTWHSLGSEESEGRGGKKDSRDSVWKNTGSIALLSLTRQVN